MLAEEVVRGDLGLLFQGALRAPAPGARRLLLFFEAWEKAREGAY